MSPTFIQSLDDPRLQPYRNLKDTNQTRWSGRFVCEGEKLTLRLLESDFQTSSVLLDQPHYDRLSPRIPHGVETLVVPAKMVPQIVGFNFHRGVLACGVRQPSPPPIPIPPPIIPTLTS